jgi:hypothetical protein
MNTRAIRIFGAFSLVVLALLIAGAEGAISAGTVTRVPIVAYRLHATLTPVGSATGSGHFDALLIKSGPGQTRVAGSPLGPTSPVVCSPNPRMGISCRIGGSGQLPPVSIPATGVHWTLIWRLRLADVTGPATASIHADTQGAASPTLTTLCTSCQALAKGHLTLTPNQSQLLLTGDSDVDVQTTSGQLTGQIVTVTHFFTMALARR